MSLEQIQKEKFTEIQGKLALCEHFLSVEGEGLWIGRPVTLIRFSGCNLRCAFCDTKFSSWWTDDVYFKTPDEIIEFCKTQGTKLVSMTGGEPFYRQGPGEMDAFYFLCKELVAQGFTLKVETDGLIFDERFCDLFAHWSISPKIPMGGMNPKENTDKSFVRYDIGVIRNIMYYSHYKIQLKFVVGMREKNNTFIQDIEEIKKILHQIPEAKHGNIPIILQPEGLTQDLMEYLGRYRDLAEAVVLKDPNGWWKDYDVRILPQAHRLAWNNERQK